MDAAAERRVGTVLRGKYHVDRVIGVGGMAIVYKVTHRNQAEFALKMLRPELSILENLRTRFLREGYAANSVKHPGAVLVVDDDMTEDGAAFLVMELLDGAPVETLWERGGYRLPVNAIAAIGYQLLDVLAAAHANGIVHRDIKPANLFLTRNGTVKVLDFGIARARDAMAGSVDSTGTGMVLGTPAFMPPEQALAKSSAIDGQTDIWAAGATLFTLMSGQFVHEGETAAQLLVTTATAPARSIATVVPDIAPPLMAVVDRALAFEKSARWPSAEAMRDALAEAYAATFGEAISRTPLSVFFGGSLAMQASLGRLVPTPLPTSRSASRAAAVPTPAPAARSAGLVAASLAGATTAQPVAHERPSFDKSALAGSGQRQALVIGSVAVTVLIVAGGGLVLRSWLSKPPASTEDRAALVSVPPLVASSAPSVGPPDVTLAPALPAETVSSAPRANPVPAPARAPENPPTTAPARSRPRPAASAAQASSPSASERPAAEPRASPPNCTVVTNYDTEGEPHFTKVCK